MAQKIILDEIDTISENLKGLEAEANEIRSYWINDRSSLEFRNDFTECLEAFHNARENSSSLLDNDNTRF
ncbi:hypothetical protein [Pseudomonas sp. NFACC45]|uniref:hypothetical protein n=1 Tax=Pseudomonas sp. NFACC45 TaxID=1566201 RepID=UPI001160C84B|nr:hypothetical protein [Pseudomonas sp. NFACC45]